ncbi:MAG: (d)CMP kinase [Pseudomonadota bacterium]
MIIAIDGEAASGKGTLARRLAAHFGLAHLDTGRLYRAVALKLMRAGRDPADEDAAAAVARAIAPADLDEPALREEAVGEAASIVAARPRVRAALLDVQRAFARHPPGGARGAVLDGRDIGTVVCPEPEVLKFFLYAGLEKRAERRFKELQARGDSPIYRRVLRDMRARDDRDRKRGIAALKPAEGALSLDTSELSAEQVGAAALRFIVQRNRARRGREDQPGPARRGAGHSPGVGGPPAPARTDDRARKA